MSETFFNPDLKVKPGGDEFRTMGGLGSVGDENFFNPDLNVKPGGDTVTTMGGLDALPSESPPTFDLGQFIGSAAQLAQLYPGLQNRPQYEPGLTDLRYTRSFTGGGEPGGSFYSPSGAGGVEGPPPNEIIYQQPLLQPQAQGALNEALLGGLLGMDWTGAYNDYLRNLEAQTQDINISNVVSPTMTNIQQQSQEQAQYMGDSTGQEQDQDQDDFDNIDIDSYVRDILSKTDGTSGGGLDDFFNKGPVTPGDEGPSDTTGTGDLSPVEFIQSKVQADQAAKAAAEAAREANRKRLVEESVERIRQQEAERQRQLAEEAERQRQEAAAEAERQRQAALQAETQARTTPIVDAATSKFQSEIANAVKQRDDLKRNLDAALEQQRKANDPIAGMAGFFKRTAKPVAPPQETINELRAGYETLNNALSNYNVGEILNNPNFARDQALQSGSNVLQALRDPNNPPPPAAVNAILSKAVSNIGADVIAQNISREGAQAILQAAGPEFIPGAAKAAAEASAKALAEGASKEAAREAGEAAASEIANSFAGDIAGPAAAALISLAQGGTAGTAIAEGAKAYAVAAIAAIPGVGPFIAAAIILDSVLSGVLGYESPVNEAVAGAAKNIDKAFSFVGRSVGSDPIGGIVDWGSRAIGSDPLGGIGRSIGRVFGFEEGGLVDLGEDSMYNEYDDYGGLFGLPFEVIPDMPAEESMMFARGGIIPLPGGGKIARGPGGGLDDLIPTSIDGKRAAALSDGEFVIPADVVSMMGDGSSNAGAKRLYDLVRQIRQDKTGTSRQAGPLQVGKILERTMR